LMIALAKPHFFADFDKFFAIWESPYRFGEVCVGTAVFGENSAGKGQYSSEIQAKQLLHGKLGGYRRLKYGRSMTRLQHPQNLREPLMEVLKIANSKTHGDCVKRIILKWQILAISLQKCDFVSQAFTLQFLAGDLQHTRRNVESRDHGYPCPTCVDGKVASASGNIKQGLGIVFAQHPHGFSPPSNVDSQAKRVIEKVVARSDVVKHLRNLFFFGTAGVLVRCYNLGQCFPACLDINVTLAMVFLNVGVKIMTLAELEASSISKLPANTTKRIE
jgi:hypothetical protein